MLSYAPTLKRTRLENEESAEVLAEGGASAGLVKHEELATPDKDSEPWLHPPIKKKRSNRRRPSDRTTRSGAIGKLDWTKEIGSPKQPPTAFGKDSRPWGDANPILSDDDSEDESEGLGSSPEAARYENEIENLKERLSDKEREAAVKALEAAALKEELRQIKLRKLETTVNQQAVQSELEAVKVDLSQRSKQLAESKRLLETKSAAIEGQQIVLDQMKLELERLRSQEQQSVRASRELSREVSRLGDANQVLDSRVGQLTEECHRLQQEKASVYMRALEDKTALRLRLMKSRSNLNRVEGIKIPKILENHAREVIIWDPNCVHNRMPCALVPSRKAGNSFRIT